MSQFCCSDATALWCLQPHPYWLRVVITQVSSKDHGGDMGGYQQEQEAHFEVSGAPKCQLQDTHLRHAGQNLDLSWVF